MTVYCQKCLVRIVNVEEFIIEYLFVYIQDCALEISCSLHPMCHQLKVVITVRSRILFKNIRAILFVSMIFQSIESSRWYSSQNVMFYFRLVMFCLSCTIERNNKTWRIFLVNSYEVCVHHRFKPILVIHVDIETFDCVSI
jgi:hypothetical protein